MDVLEKAGELLQIQLNCHNYQLELIGDDDESNEVDSGDEADGDISVEGSTMSASIKLERIEEPNCQSDAGHSSRLLEGQLMMTDDPNIITLSGDSEPDEDGQVEPNSSKVKEPTIGGISTFRTDPTDSVVFINCSGCGRRFQATQHHKNSELSPGYRQHCLDCQRYEKNRNLCECRVCGKQYFCSSQLSEHLKSHSTEDEVQVATGSEDTRDESPSEHTDRGDLSEEFIRIVAKKVETSKIEASAPNSLFHCLPLFN
jgi:hypothetical protein